MRAYFLRFSSALPNWLSRAQAIKREYVSSLIPLQRWHSDFNPLVRPHRSRCSHRLDALGLRRLRHCPAMKKLRFVRGRLTWTKVRGVES